MFVVTNRELDEGVKGLDVFGSVPNAKGPNELRLVKVTKAGSGYQSEVLKDELTEAEVAKLVADYGLDIDVDQKWYASLAVSCELMDRACASDKHILFWVHGYNNDMKDIMQTAAMLEKLYNVIVVPFTWPANGGGAVSGTLAYLSDKRDARASAEALNRFVGKVHAFHAIHAGIRQRRAMDKATAKHPENPEARQALFTRLLEKECRVTLNLACHSMGVYVLKHALRPSEAESRSLVFDNVSLISADANNQHHERWAGEIQAKNRLYVVINENDGALEWSRRKPGEEQLTRLGHYLKNLTVASAHYLNVTAAAWVKDEHSYFKGPPVAKNKSLKAMFKAMFRGDRAEEAMRYRVDINAYEPK